MKGLQYMALTLVAVTSTSLAAETMQVDTIKEENVRSQILGQADHHLAWGLTENEYDEYQKLMKDTPAKMRYQQLEPAEVLGIMADSVTKRKHYAAIVAKSQHERVKKELAFQMTYEQEFKKLFPKALVVGDDGMKRFSGKKLTKPEAGDRLIFFADTSSEASRIVLTKLLNVLSQNISVGMDVYLVGQETKASINAWAQKHKVPLEWVKKKVVTLNFDQGLFQKMFEGLPEELPVVALNRKGKLQMVALNSI